MGQRSLKANALLNGIKSSLSLLAPLITFPYLSRVLQVENIGKLNFTMSYIGYFNLLAGLGIATYAIREGVKCRDDKTQIESFCSGIFTLNLISTLISIIILILSVFYIDKLAGYRQYILILSPTILFTTIGVDWFFSIYEDYLYVTVRSICLHVLNILLVFLFIKNEQDLIKYCIIQCFTAFISSIINLKKATDYCLIKPHLHSGFSHIIKPVLLLFASLVAVSIYTSSDITILGLMKSDYEVGLYSVAVKIYNAFKTLFSAFLAVSIPRLSRCLAEHKTEEYNHKFSNIFTLIITLLVPAMVGLFLIADDVILLIAGETYIDAALSLKILSVSLIVCFFGWMYSSCVIIPHGKDRQLLYIMLVSAGINIILNIIFIPLYAQNAAATTTLVSEAVSMALCMKNSKGLVLLNLENKNIVSVIIGSTLIICSCLIINVLDLNYPIQMIIKIIVSALVYGIVMLLFKNTAVMDIINSLRMKRI